MLRLIAGVEGPGRRRPRIDRRAKKTKVFGVEVEAWKVWHDVLSHLAPRDSRAALYGVQPDFLFVFLLPSLDLRACISIGQLLQLSLSACLSSLRHRLIPI
jgi:hypothetical protein